MSRLSPSPSNLYRSQSVASVATSDTTYHSFYDVELFEPASPGTVSNIKGPTRTHVVGLKEEMQEEPTPKLISRQDSGYESASVYASSRSSALPSSRGRSITSTAPSTATSRSGNMMQMQSRAQKRPGVHRAVRSAPISRVHSGKSVNLVPISSSSSSSSSSHSHHQPQQQYSNTYYYFPPPEVISGEVVVEEEADESQQQPQQQQQQQPQQTPYHPPPPQTTHYWMSDHTRRLEYAAIDAASRGVKGWIMRHVVPDCFVPKDHRRLHFDDDSGSVRRYRLDLDDVELECGDDDDDDDLGGKCLDGRANGNGDAKGKRGGKRGRKFGWFRR